MAAPRSIREVAAMAFPFKRYEEYRTSHTLLHLCLEVEESLPPRSRTGQDLLYHCGQASISIVSASAALSRRACIEKLSAARAHASDGAKLLRSLQRRRRGSRAHVTAGLEICERLSEQLAHRIERLERRSP